MPREITARVALDIVGVWHVYTDDELVDSRNEDDHTAPDVDTALAWASDVNPAALRGVGAALDANLRWRRPTGVHRDADRRSQSART